MYALVGSIEQVGMTVGIGLLLDTLIVRSFLMPSLVACSDAGSGGRGCPAVCPAGVQHVACTRHLS
jgi:hypothetical protein